MTSNRRNMVTLAFLFAGGQETSFKADNIRHYAGGPLGLSCASDDGLYIFTRECTDIVLCYDSYESATETDSAANAYSIESVRRIFSTEILTVAVDRSDPIRKQMAQSKNQVY